MLEPGPVHTSQGLHIIPSTFQLGQEKSEDSGETALHSCGDKAWPRACAHQLPPRQESKGLAKSSQMLAAHP